jgi:hypothetical protein
MLGGRGRRGGGGAAESPSAPRILGPNGNRKPNPRESRQRRRSTGPITPEGKRNSLAEIETSQTRCTQRVVFTLPLRSNFSTRVLCANMKMESVAAMTIEIHKPELEALILERMKIGGFRNVEDALMQALETSPMAQAKPVTEAKNGTGADLIAAMQASPYREIEIEPARYRMPVREVSF